MPSVPPPPTPPTTPQLDAVVVGAGFAGLYQLYRLRELGLAVRVFEACDDIGGTWFRNRYPGARCGIESTSYSYSFSPELDQEWEWSERYATQPELLRYLHHVADRFGLRTDITLRTRVTRAVYDEGAHLWQVSTDAGETLTTRFVILATGCVSAVKDPDIPGAATFEGQVLHTADWPRAGVDVTGRRVAVIGTGCSGVQAIPLLAEQAAALTVFQRTPVYAPPATGRCPPRRTPNSRRATRSSGSRSGSPGAAPSSNRRPGPPWTPTTPSAPHATRPAGSPACSADCCGRTTTSSSTRRPTRPSPTSSAPGSARSSPTPRRPRRCHRAACPTGPSAPAWTPVTTPRTTNRT